MPRSPARKTDACVDSGTPGHWLSDGRNSSDCRGKHSAEQEDADRGNLSRHLDCVACVVHLWSDPDLIGAIFFSVEHFLHPAGCPGVPLEKLTPAWIPGRLVIGYLTGAILLIAGASILLNKKTRIAATYLGTWIVLLVLFIYGPILI